MFNMNSKGRLQQLVFTGSKLLGFIREVLSQNESMKIFKVKCSLLFIFPVAKWITLSPLLSTWDNDDDFVVGSARHRKSVSCGFRQAREEEMDVWFSSPPSPGLLPSLAGSACSLALSSCADCPTHPPACRLGLWLRAWALKCDCFCLNRNHFLACDLGHISDTLSLCPYLWCEGNPQFTWEDGIKGPTYQTRCLEQRAHLVAFILRCLQLSWSPQAKAISSKYDPAQAAVILCPFLSPLIRLSPTKGIGKELRSYFKKTAEPCTTLVLLSKFHEGEKEQENANTPYLPLIFQKQCFGYIRN